VYHEVVYRATHGVNSSKALKKRRYIENTLYLKIIIAFFRLVLIKRSSCYFLHVKYVYT